MKPYIRTLLYTALIFAFVPFAFAAGMTVYSTIPSSLPPNLPSLGYEASSAAEFGELIQFAGTGSSYNLSGATVLMSNWAYESLWTSAINSTTITNAGFYEPLTLNLYNVGAGNTVGSLIASDTVNAFIPWRPEPSSSCGTGWQASDGNCYNGSLSEVNFNLTGITTPGEIIYGLAYNTTDYGANPTHVSGPYDSLNFALPTTGASVGSNPLPDTAYWNTSYAGFYADNGASGVGTFRQDTGWTPYEGGIAFTATPEPSSLLLFGSGLGSLVAFYRRKRKSA